MLVLNAHFTDDFFVILGFKFGPDSITGNKQTLTWHRILEAFKFGYAYRPFIGDPEFYPNVEKVRLRQYERKRKKQFYKPQKS